MCTVSRRDKQETAEALVRACSVTLNSIEHAQNGVIHRPKGFLSSQLCTVQKSYKIIQNLNFFEQLNFVNHYKSKNKPKC